MTDRRPWPTAARRVGDELRRDSAVAGALAKRTSRGPVGVSRRAGAFCDGSVLRDRGTPPISEQALSASRWARRCGISTSRRILFCRLLRVCWDYLGNEIAEDAGYIDGGQVTISACRPHRQTRPVCFGARHRSAVRTGRCDPWLEDRGAPNPADVVGLMASAGGARTLWCLRSTRAHVARHGRARSRRASYVPAGQAATPGRD